MAIQYISSSLTDTYYAVTNAQGDVVALVDGSGTVVVNYTYDAWGKLKSMTGSKASTVGKYFFRGPRKCLLFWGEEERRRT